MSSYYSVIRFVSSALAEEFINVGVLSFGDGRVRGKFLENWRRVENFADSAGVRHARAFQEWILESMAPEGPSGRRTKRIDEDTVRRIANDWAGSVQLSAPRASLLDPDALLEDVASAFLVEPPSTHGECVACHGDAALIEVAPLTRAEAAEKRLAELSRAIIAYRLKHGLEHEDADCPWNNDSGEACTCPMVQAIESGLKATEG